MAALPAGADQAPHRVQHKFKHLPFAPRLQFNGVIKWLCPGCGGINRTRIAPRQGWGIWCEQRGAVFRCGWVLWQQPRGRGSTVPLDEPFPTAQTAFLDRQRYIHRVEPLDISEER
jgi:hypothetical protein